MGNVSIMTRAGLPLMIADDARAFDLLEEGWKRMGGTATSPMQSLEWARACVETFHAKDELRLVILGTLERPLAVAPLVVRPGGRLELAGVRALSEPTDFTYSSPEALGLLTRGLARLNAPMELGRVPSDSPLLGSLQLAFRLRSLVLTSEPAGSPYIPLDSSWARPESKLNAGRRSDLRRMQRRAEQLGPVRYEMLEPTPAELPPLFQQALEVEDRGWKGQQGTSLLRDLERQAFFRRYTAATAANGQLRLNLMRIGERPVAMQLGVELGGKLWLLKMGYDEAFASCSPGMLLMLQAVGHAARGGLHALELLGGPEPWVKMWTQQVRPCNAIRVYPAGPKGAMALGSDAVSVARRRLARLVEAWA
jgi:CelD/BcsL family acetyltransferase involved in cellulose biosynthesis